MQDFPGGGEGLTICVAMARGGGVREVLPCNRLHFSYAGCISEFAMVTLHVHFPKMELNFT